MRKRDELTDPNSCLNKAKDDEPLFVLCARDLCAQTTVLAWINARLESGKNKPDDPQIIEAYQWCNLATEWLASCNRKRSNCDEAKS